MNNAKYMREFVNIITVIVSPVVFISLIYYISVYFSSSNICINPLNVNNYLTFIIGTFILTITSLVLTYWNRLSIKRIDKLTSEVLRLQTLNIELQMQFKDEIIAKLGGDKLD